MSSIVERLTEGVVNRDMRAESHALLSKWKKTGLLEGLDTERQANSMARLLENQAKELLREANTMSSGDVEGFAAVAFPIVRRVFAGLIANDLVLGDGNTQSNRFGNLSGSSIYGTDQVGSQVTGGVDLVGAQGQDLSGPRSSARGYAYASPTASVTTTAASKEAEFNLDGSETLAQLKLIDFDPDLLALSGSGYKVIVLDAQKSDYDSAQADFNNLSAFEIGGAALNTALSGAAGLEDDTTYTLVRRLTKIAGTDVRYVVTALSSAVGAVTRNGNLVAQVPQTDNFTAGGGLGSVAGTTTWGLEGNGDIPEIDIKVDSIAVTAQTKKLKAKWTPELGQDLNAYHNLDAEVELTSLLSEQIALEIDREILADLVNGATAATRYWSRAPGLFVDSNGNEIGASTKAPDFTGTVSEWYETLVETINDVSAQIHRKTLRGGANFVVCGPEVANILEFTAGFRASVTHTDEKGSIGALKVGSLSKKFDVIVDPYFLRNVILVGRRGGSFLESGYVYAPYVPLQTTPTIFGPEDFVPRKGVMTRYAKKMVRPDMYGLVIVRGLLGESGA
jgi:hypothetical protein